MARRRRSYDGQLSAGIRTPSLPLNWGSWRAGLAGLGWAGTPGGRGVKTVLKSDKEIKH